MGSSERFKTINAAHHVSLSVHRSSRKTYPSGKSTTMALGQFRLFLLGRRSPHPQRSLRRLAGGSRRWLASDRECQRPARARDRKIRRDGAQQEGDGQSEVPERGLRRDSGGGGHQLPAGHRGGGRRRFEQV